MLVRPKLFLTFLVLCLPPLVLLAIINYWQGTKAAEVAFGRGLEAELTAFRADVNSLLQQSEAELIMLARSEAMRDYVRAGTSRDFPVNGVERTSRSGVSFARTDTAKADLTLPAELRVSLASILGSRSYFSRIVLFDRTSHPVFSVEPATGDQVAQLIVVRTKVFLPGQVEPDQRVWTTRTLAVLHSRISSGSIGATLPCTVPVFPEGSGMAQGAVVGELKLDSIFSAAARVGEASSVGAASHSMKSVPRLVLVLDRSGRILYHPNEALKHQLVSSSLPYFLPVASRMMSGEIGREAFTSSTGEEYWAAHSTIPALDVSVAAARNYEMAMNDSRQAGRVGLIVSGLLALTTAFFLTLYWQRRSRGIQRVTEGVVAIAQGKLDQRIEVQSSDEIRLLADNVNLMSERLREQIVLEAEARQVQSFVKLSAMLTHDLKNAIGGLSLIVGNMEQHFNNEEFRADAMNALTGATEKLKALVERLSNPVTTLSGEFKRPKPTNLVPILKRVISLTAEPLRGTLQIETRLPQSLFALVDGERVEKVVENLVLNALEAMLGKSGTLTVSAGKAENGEVFFSVTDTGVGMSARFIEERLFRPFATTKKKGVGLGLYTCREVARANGGRIEVDSREGAGTTFRVMLPSAPIEQRG